MPVSTPHGDYRGLEYEVMRLSHEGQTSIKGESTQFLPMPSGTAAIEDSVQRDAAYSAYLMRATYTSLIAAAVEGLSGMAHRAPWKIELPDKLKHMYEEASPDMGMAELVERLVREVLLTGRIGLVCEAVGNKPYLMPYAAESIINWRVDGKLLSQVVLKELAPADTADRFVRTTSTIYRVLEMFEGQYVQSEWRETSPNAADHSEVNVPVNYQYGHLPFSLISSQSTDISRRDAIPLQPMADHLLKAYRLSADLSQAQHMVSQPTAYAFGIAKEHWPTMLGSAVIVCSEAADAKLGFAETSGNGISGLQESVREEINSALLHSHHLAERGQQVESGEALGIRVATRTASLSSVVKNSAYGLAQSLRQAARWAGARENEIIVKPNMDFVQNQVDPQVIKEMAAQVALGILPPSVYYDYLRETAMTTKDDEELTEEVEEQREKVEARAAAAAKNAFDDQNDDFDEDELAA